ncbi:hypothetical protein BST27_13465 [Mycobacterium intermedium]|uniref:Uncharacterized protein n=1 Tax=Mycobacterium intermedium TaxID=28445 RepID=A0A1E3SP78_MYCIE|nr:hypothetical protein BHQ20_00950 [Mycobacterium intermedium]OPE48901.1 hypothetical protein BV508_16285 [Mycobacterium intermedium]ORB05165.1 hypothetical protein BST27_13465 [Mycobacterium intermedium]
MKRAGLIAGGVVLVLALLAGSWWLGLVSVAVMGAIGWTEYSAWARASQELEPWPWPAELRAGAEAMVRRIDPTPERIIPLAANQPDLAQVASTFEGLEQLLAERLPLWPWAVFASVLVLRRNAVQRRLRNCALGYQPGRGRPLNGQQYSHLVWKEMSKICEIVHQLETFMLSPAFTGALNAPECAADADSIVHIASRLMDYHEDILRAAERCLQTPVEADVIVFVQDVCAFAMCPLVGYDKFIATMCSRVAEGQELLPYANGVIELDEALLGIDLPDGLMEQINRHTKKFNP